MPDAELLTDQQLSILIRGALTMAQRVCHSRFCDPHPMGQAEVCKATTEAIEQLGYLIATVKQLGRDNEALETQCKGLRGQSAELRNRISERNDRIVDLQSQLEQLRAENEKLREQIADEKRFDLVTDRTIKPELYQAIKEATEKP